MGPPKHGSGTYRNKITKSEPKNIKLLDVIKNMEGVEVVRGSGSSQSRVNLTSSKRESIGREKAERAIIEPTPIPGQEKKKSKRKNDRKIKGRTNFAG